MKKLILLLIVVFGFYSCDGDKKSKDKKDPDKDKKAVVFDVLQPSFPVDDPTVRSQANFDEYAWQMFVAMNWPASTTERGKPDTSKTIEDVQGLRVWQSLRTSESVFLPKAANPGDWNAGYGSGATLTLSNTSKVDSTIKEKLTGIGQAVGGPLVDQNLQYVYFEKFMNEVEYNNVVSNKYYDLSVLQKIDTNLVLPDGSMEIKSAWKVMGEGDTPSDFFTANAIIEAPDSENGTPVTVGLVGLHIIYKSKSSPQWVWATFEHKDNAPDEKDAKTATGHFSFFNPECTDCKLNEKQGDKPKFATQVARYTPIRQDAINANTKWQGLLKNTVWKNYELITTQWPNDPNNQGDPQGDPTPNLSANTTMETYIQSFSSCMACHSTAAPVGSSIRTDYSFLFLEANAKPTK
jgi:hypothetical protein